MFIPILSTKSYKYSYIKPIKQNLYETEKTFYPNINKHSNACLGTT
jgi:hypothetical protein